MAGAVWAGGAIPALAGEPAESDAAVDDLERGGWISHVGCSFFGEHREDYLLSGLGAEMLAAEQRSKLTAAVTARLDSSVAPPLRSRTSARMAESSGPIAGDSIDAFIFGELEKQGIPPAPPTTDSEFLRRATLDLLGRIPTEAESFAFLSDARQDKRALAIQYLLADSRWADRWAMFFGDLYRNTQLTAQVNRFPGGRDALHLFLLESMRLNKPYDQMVREMLASGGINDGRAWPAATTESPFASFADYQTFLRTSPPQASGASYIVGGRMTGGPMHDTYDNLATVAARDLLGITHMDCVLCHNGAGHLESLNLWGVNAKRSDGWGFAAFFQKVQLQRARYRVPPRTGDTVGPVPPYYVVIELPDGRVIRNRNGDLVAGEYSLDTDSGNRPSRTPDQFGGKTKVDPLYPFGGGTPGAGEPLRQALGRLLTADRQFARAAVNYVWREFFGRGIVDPPDQFDLMRLSATNPPPEPWSVQPSHPELLEWLAKGFEEHGYDLKWLMATITSSRAYQLSSRYDGAWSPSYDRYLARHQASRIPAEALLDSVTISSGVTINMPTNSVVGTVVFALQLPDVQNTPNQNRNRPELAQTVGMLDAFFRGDRQESQRSSEVSILQALHLMNNPVIVARIEQSGRTGSLSRLLGESDDALVGRLYLTVLSRFATPDELAAGVAYLRGGDRRQRAEDLMWSLYNKVDFVFNY
ncbi:MAG: DUF1553 domain-containing protein [Bryobacterales bacterium]